MKHSKVAMEIENMAMGKTKAKGIIGDKAAGKLKTIQTMQDKMDMTSVAMLKKFNMVELEAMGEAHEKMEGTHRRIYSMIESITEEESDEEESSDEE